MAVTPSGFLSLPIDYGMDTLAGSSTWRSWGSWADAAAAKAAIEIGSADPSTFPVAILTPNAGDFGEAVGDGDGFTFENGGVLYLMLKASISESDGNDAYFDFRNKVGAVLAEMMANAGEPGYLSIHRWSIAREQRRSAVQHEKHATAYFDIIVQLEWGL